MLKRLSYLWTGLKLMETRLQLGSLYFPVIKYLPRLKALSLLKGTLLEVMMLARMYLTDQENLLHIKSVFLLRDLLLQEEPFHLEEMNLLLVVVGFPLFVAENLCIVEVIHLQEGDPHLQLGGGLHYHLQGEWDHLLGALLEGCVEAHLFVGGRLLHAAVHLLDVLAVLLGGLLWFVDVVVPPFVGQSDLSQDLFLLGEVEPL
jgi:hypothetical protein